ncbi:four-carbon acid sugar kinase family protein [Pseudonocardia sp. TRM90224]|uniref:four-carbon acid sugar kinase family protein n=1 Tax=Pseudonocardia sp. TRM90224 TaxID=2812678 RepID=UPI001E62B2B0|nr:four-carbon acid sugar kinase family protein [Pseudonocardia sp. TRM90224]
MPRASLRRLAVVADDLTGAADAAAPFAARGLAVSVALDGPPPQVDVLAVLTDNRWRPADEAARRMRAAVEATRAWGAESLFIKIDSTLRGRVHDDVATALSAWPGKAVATPAFPAQGRVVRGGALLVHGEPTVALVAECFPPHVDVLDAATHDELLAIAAQVVADDQVAIGSGGLSRALAEVLVPQPRLPDQREPSTAGVLVVAGTPHPVTREQVHRLAAGTDPAALRAGRRVVVTTDLDGELDPDGPEAAAHAAELAATVRGIVDEVPGVRLVLTGGATALAVANALGATELRLHGEVAPGLPIGELLTADRAIPVVTKSGGFGAPDALCRAVEALEVHA